MIRPRILRTLLMLPLLWVGIALGDGPAPGAVAPDFRLQDQSGAWHETKSYRGKWLVLYFYAKDQLPSSTDVAKEFGERNTAFRDAGATVVGISVDDVESHKKFAQRVELPFRILADPTKQTTRNYGALKSYLGGMDLARPDTFLIDPEGRVIKRYTDYEPKGHAEVVLKEVRERKQTG